MQSNESLLTTAQVASALGVGTSSIKRWADQGLLRCERTPGGHRRIPRSALAEFLRGEHEPAEERSDFASHWCELLLNPEGPPSVFEPLMAERRARTTWCKTADALGVVTTRIGKLWESGDIDVLDEHLATTRLERAVARCTEAIKMPAGAPTCLLVTAPGEDHTLGLTLVEPCLREAGWHTQWAGRRTPIVPIMDRIEDGSIQGVAASASAYSTDGIALASFADHIGEVCQRNGVALWLGGTGAWPDRLAYGHRLSSFVELDALARPASERHRAERYPTT